MAFATRFPKVRDHSKHFNEGTWMGYHEAPPLARVVALVGDAGQAKPHLEHNPLSLLGTYHATPIRKLNGAGESATDAHVLSLLLLREDSLFILYASQAEITSQNTHSRLQ